MLISKQQAKPSIGHFNVLRHVLSVLKKYQCMGWRAYASNTPNIDKAYFYTMCIGLNLVLVYKKRCLQL